MNCTHKRKKGHKPTADCLDCWTSWMEESPDAIITAKDFRRIMVVAVGIREVKMAAWAAYSDMLWKKVIGEGEQ